MQSTMAWEGWQARNGRGGMVCEGWQGKDDRGGLTEEAWQRGMSVREGR